MEVSIEATWSPSSLAALDTSGFTGGCWYGVFESIDKSGLYNQTPKLDKKTKFATTRKYIVNMTMRTHREVIQPKVCRFS